MSPASCLLAGLLLAPAADLKPKPFDWPQWRGPNRDGVSAETGLLKKWPDGGPPKAWTATGLGGGYGTPSVVGGFVFGVGLLNGKEAVWAVKESDGKIAWTAPFADFKNVGYGEGPRSTPTYHNGKLYAIGVSGDLVCVAADSGKVLWKKSFSKDFGGRMMSGWGYCESPLVDGSKLICTPGGDVAAVVALNATTGALLWKSEVKNAGGAGYGSPVRAEVGGVAMYITLLGKSGGYVAVHATTGKLLWQYARVANGTANIPTAVVKDDLVFLSTGYGDGGSALLKMSANGWEVSIEELKYYPAKELQNHHGGMVLVGDHLYMGRNHNSGLPTCVEFKTGNIVWKEDNGAGRGNGSGSVTAADGMLYFHYQNGVMALVKASPDGFELAGRFDLPQKSGKPSWPHPVVANGRLYVRDQDKLHAFDVKAK